LVSLSKELTTEKKRLAALRPPLKSINPARVKASRVVTACSSLAKEWRWSQLYNGWCRWRLFSTQAREHEEVLEKQATRVQAIFRGYRVRTLLADKDTHGPESDRAARIITRFLRQLGHWKRESAARDKEEAAIRIQAAFKRKVDLADFRANSRRRVNHALAVMGGGSVSKVLRGVGWGTYAPLGDGGVGIYKQSWTIAAAAMAGFSRVTPSEQALSPEACERIGAYLGSECTLADCFVLARAVGVVEELGSRSTLYSRAELVRTVAMIEDLSERVVRGRKLRRG